MICFFNRNLFQNFDVVFRFCSSIVDGAGKAALTGLSLFLVCNSNEMVVFPLLMEILNDFCRHGPFCCDTHYYLFPGAGHAFHFILIFTHLCTGSR